MSALRIAAEICEDIWVPNSPSIFHAERANLIVNLSASNEIVEKQLPQELVSNHPRKLFQDIFMLVRDQ